MCPQRTDSPDRPGENTDGTGVCVICGLDLDRGLTCSERCEALRLRMYAGLMVEIPGWYLNGFLAGDDPLLAPLHEASERDRLATPPCVVCGEHVGGRLRYCSDECARKARIVRLPSHGAPADYAALLRRDPCSYCGGAGGGIDHIVARAREGADGWENLTGTCGRCNSSKCDRPLLEHLLRVR
jgi:predicted nucleic acid-binding Zn ribbon protein